MPQLTTALLNETIDIERLSGSTIDDRGNSSVSWAVSSSSVQARITDLRDRTESEDDFLEQNIVRLRCVVPANTDVTVRDRVSYDSVKYNIKGIKNYRDRFGNTFYKQLVIESGY
tara:strand:+ start:867 stop:1211 length:345 start_codon:yes stop_codon:yes gene_type:complete